MLKHLISTSYLAVARCISGVSLYVPATSQVRLKSNIERCLGGTSPKHHSCTFSQHLVGTSWRRPKRTNQRRSISTCTRRLKKVSNKTLNDILVVRHKGVLVVRIHNVPLVRFYNLSCNRQMKNPITFLWYVSSTSRSYVVRTSC